MIAVEIPDDGVYDTPATGKITGASERAINSEVRKGRLKAHLRLGKRWFTGRDIKAWLTSQPYQPNNPDHQDEVDGIASA